MQEFQQQGHANEDAPKEVCNNMLTQVANHTAVANDKLHDSSCPSLGCSLLASQGNALPKDS